MTLDFQTLRLSDLLKTTRQYFWGQNFDEVEIPYLNPSLPLEPNIYSFTTTWAHSHETFYLPASPEFALKEHLVTTKHNCFSIAHCFRDLEAEGPHHTKEFLMLEYYLVNQNLTDLQDSLVEYLSLFCKFKIINYQLPANLPNNEPDFNQYFLNEIEPNLPHDCGVFVTGYPSFLSPLAEPEQRFEFYLNGVEIANGCIENRDSTQIKLAFEKEAQYRLENQLPSHPYSQEFLHISADLPPCSGVGIGLSRLASLL